MQEDFLDITKAKYTKTVLGGVFICFRIKDAIYISNACFIFSSVYGECTLSDL